MRENSQDWTLERSQGDGVHQLQKTIQSDAGTEGGES